MSKIQNLFYCYPQGVVLTSSLLAKEGYTSQLMQKYLKSGWVKRLGDGAYQRSSDIVSWQGALWPLQQEKTLRISGKTALELQGYEHFLSLGRSKIYISYVLPVNIPKWVKNYDFGADLVFIRSFNVDPLYVNDVSASTFTLKASCLELAALEVCEGILKYYTYESALYFFESLSSLRADIVQQLLKKEFSIKAKRLFLHFSEIVGHNWFSHLDLSEINFGSGKRQIVKNGKFDPKYLITVPETSQ